MTDYLTIAKLKDIVADHEGVVSVHLHPNHVYDLVEDSSLIPLWGQMDHPLALPFTNVDVLIATKGVRVFESTDLPPTEIRVVDVAGNVHRHTVATS